MNLFGWRLTREKALDSVDGRRGWWPLIREPYPGAWQNNDEESMENVLGYGPAFSCMTLIASDIAKLRCRLVAKDEDGIWNETENASYSPVLRRPNHFQNRIQFIESWILSKLSRGNTYVLKQRDRRGVVVAEYVLHPDRVQPLVAENGDVYYRLCKDNLSQQSDDDVIVPAREIIHDRFNCLYHPLVGLSPIYACAIAAGQGLKIQRASSRLFANGARPSGILTAPGEIDDTTAARLKTHWETQYGGENVGKVAVLGDGLKFESMTMKSVDAQLIEQLKWTAEQVCSCFHVPAYMIGVGDMPKFDNIEALIQQYYSQCLQSFIESYELCQDEGLELKAPYGTEFDLDDLLRMDTATQIKTLAEATKGGLMKPDEGRRKLGFGKVPGGDAVYMQEQNYSLEALAKRDAKDDPFAKGKTDTPPVAANNDNEEARQAASLVSGFLRGMSNA